MERWDVAFFRQVKWRWPEGTIRPLGEAIIRQNAPVDPTVNPTTLPIISKISFGGELTVTAPDKRRGYKGRLFWAEAGDLVYSKIRVKQGSLCIVPDSVGKVAVSAEYPVYKIARDVADAGYVALVVRSAAFMRLLEGLSHGGSTKTRIAPEEFQRQPIPLPPLAIQRKIVAAWDAARKDAAAIAEKIAQLERDIEARFLADLGITPPSCQMGPKCLAGWWRNLERWDLAFARRTPFNPKSNMYPNARLRDVVQPIRRTTRRVLPGMTPDKRFNYIGMENVEAGTGILVDFLPRKGGEIKSSCVVFDRNHILYGKLRPYLRKVIDCSELPFSDGVASSEFLSLRPCGCIMQSWLAFYLRSVAIAEQAKTAIGTRMPRIAPSAFLDFTVPLPPMSVQQDMMKRVATCRAEIAKLKANAKARADAAKADVEAMILGTKPV
jgi:restriction endonuclease S subunit